MITQSVRPALLSSARYKELKLLLTLDFVLKLSSEHHEHLLPQERLHRLSPSRIRFCKGSNPSIEKWNNKAAVESSCGLLREGYRVTESQMITQRQNRYLGHFQDGRRKSTQRQMNTCINSPPDFRRIQFAFYPRPTNPHTPLALVPVSTPLIS